MQHSCEIHPGKIKGLLPLAASAKVFADVQLDAFWNSEFVIPVAREFGSRSYCILKLVTTLGINNQEKQH